MKLSALEEMLLTTLYKRGRYGLEIITAIKKVAKLNVGFGSLYPTLRQLEKKGLVKSHWGNKREGPRRRYYKISHTGRKALLNIKEMRINLMNWGCE